MSNEQIKQIKSTYTKEFIQQQLTSNPKWVERSLIKLYERQTRDEQTTRETSNSNGVGFNKSDSRYLSYCSQWVLSGRSLSGNHLIKCGVKLQKYWGQILDEIIQHQSRSERVS